MVFTLAANNRPISSASSSKCREYGKRDVNVIKFSKIKFTENLEKEKLQIFENQRNNHYEVQSVGRMAHITKAPNIAEKKT